MTAKDGADAPIEINSAHFQINDLDDEIRVDRLCVEMLQRFAAVLREGGAEPLDAGRFARGADYFIRDFLVADRRDNILEPDPERIRQFAGNWYIITNLEPNIDELADVLAGVESFYQFLVTQRLLDEDELPEIGEACTDLGHYKERIEAFWAIEGDGFSAWNQGCPVT